MNDEKKVSGGLWRVNHAFETIEDILLENGGEITPDIESVLARQSEDLESAVDNIKALIARNKAYKEQCDAEVKRIQALKKARENTEKRLTEWLLSTLKGMGYRGCETATTKVTIVSNPESVEMSEDLILERYSDAISSVVEESARNLPSYFKVKVEISKSDIKEELKAGHEIVGAALTRKESLRIK